MRIGEMAQAAGISEYTLRYYEKKGLIRMFDTGIIKYRICFLNFTRYNDTVSSVAHYWTGPKNAACQASSLLWGWV